MSHLVLTFDARPLQGARCFRSSGLHVVCGAFQAHTLYGMVDLGCISERIDCSWIVFENDGVGKRMGDPGPLTPVRQ